MSQFGIRAKLCAGKSAIGSSIQARSAGGFMSQQWRIYGLSDIRIYTKANEADRVPPLANPPISIQSHLPAFTFIEPEKHQVLVQLMCVLSLEGHRLKITPLIEPEDV